MSATIESLYHAALALPEEQRAELAERLRASLSGTIASPFEEDFRNLAEQWRTETASFRHQKLHEARLRQRVLAHATATRGLH